MRQELDFNKFIDPEKGNVFAVYLYKCTTPWVGLWEWLISSNSSCHVGAGSHLKQERQGGLQHNEQERPKLFQGLCTMLTWLWHLESSVHVYFCHKLSIQVSSTQCDHVLCLNLTKPWKIKEPCGSGKLCLHTNKSIKSSIWPTGYAQSNNKRHFLCLAPVIQEMQKSVCGCMCEWFPLLMSRWLPE